MKIAVASSGKDQDSEVSPVAGRAPYFLIYEDKNLSKTIKNPFAFGGGGAGFGVAKMLGDEGVNLIIAGHFGEKIIGALEERNIKKQEITGKTIKEAIKTL